MSIVELGVCVAAGLSTLAAFAPIIPSSGARRRSVDASKYWIF
jgi:hypothetical protein